MRQCSTAKRGVERQLTSKTEDLDREVEINKNISRLNAQLANQMDALQFDLARTSLEKEIKDEEVELLAEECEELIFDLASTSMEKEIKERQVQLLIAECRELLTLCTSLEQLEADNQRQIREQNARIAQLEQERSASRAQQQEEVERVRQEGQRDVAKKQEEIDALKLKHDTFRRSALPKVIASSVAFSRRRIAEMNAHLDACMEIAERLEDGQLIEPNFQESQIDPSSSILQTVQEALNCIESSNFSTLKYNKC